jgi:hypothetical protein
MRRSWVAHLSRGAKGGALEVDGLDEHLPPVFPGTSSIVDSGLPRTCRGLPDLSHLPRASRGSGRDRVAARGAFEQPSHSLRPPRLSDLCFDSVFSYCFDPALRMRVSIPR